MADSNQNIGMEKLSGKDKSVDLEPNDKQEDFLQQEELPSNWPEQVSGYSSTDVPLTEQDLPVPTNRINRKIDLMLTRIDKVEYNLGLTISALLTRVNNTKSRQDTVKTKVAVIHDQQSDIKKLKDMIHEKDSHIRVRRNS